MLSVFRRFVVSPRHFPLSLPFRSFTSTSSRFSLSHRSFSSTPAKPEEADDSASVKHFLGALNQSSHAEKFTSWSHLMSCSGPELRKLEIPIKQRKIILKGIEEYKQRIRYQKVRQMIAAEGASLTPAQLQEKLYAIFYQHVYEAAAYRQEQLDLEFEWRLRGDKRRQLQRDRGNEFYSIWETPKVELPEDMPEEDWENFDKSSRFVWKELNDPHHLLERELSYRKELRENLRETGEAVLGVTPEQLKEAEAEAEKAFRDEEAGEEDSNEWMTEEEKREEARAEEIRKSIEREYQSTLEKVMSKRDADQLIQAQHEASLGEGDPLEKLEEQYELQQELEAARIIMAEDAEMELIERELGKEKFQLYLEAMADRELLIQEAVEAMLRRGVKFTNTEEAFALGELVFGDMEPPTPEQRRAGFERLSSMVPEVDPTDLAASKETILKELKDIVTGVKFEPRPEKLQVPPTIPEGAAELEATRLKRVMAAKKANAKKQ